MQELALESVRYLEGSLEPVCNLLDSTVTPEYKKRVRRSPLPYDIELEQEGLVEMEDGDISDCIIAIPCH